MEKFRVPPNLDGRLRHNILKMPTEIDKASGIIFNGVSVKSIAFTTDLAIIRNCNADAILSVYPFTAQPVINDHIIKAAYMPVFCGIGGGITKGKTCLALAKHAESQGAFGVVLNAPTTNKSIINISKIIDIPIIITVTRIDTNVQSRLDSGASILNVACGQKTAEVVKKIRSSFPTTPIIASGGKSSADILSTIEAGANAITYTPPTTQELFKKQMELYRDD